MLAVLKGEPARNTVNAPFVAPEVHEVLAPFVPAASTVGKLLGVLSEGQITGITVRYEGEIAQHDCRMLQAAVLAGLLAPGKHCERQPDQRPGAGQGTRLERHRSEQPDVAGCTPA